MQPEYYDFNVRFPIYETNILNLTNVKHPDADFSLHENLERMILETGDEMKKSTNVKADMTNWTMHKTHTGFKQLADIVISIIDELNLDECYLVGWSMGSAVSLTISKKIPEKIKKMVLITPFSWIEGERFKDNYLFKLLVGGVRIRERLFPNKNPQSKFSYLKKSKALRNEFTDWAWNNLHQSKNDFIYGDGGRHVVAFDSREWLSEIQTETLAIIGGRDSLVPQKASKEVTSNMMNVKSVTFKDALHGIPWTHDEELIDELKQFLNL